MAQQGLERIPYAVGPDFRMEPVRARFPEQSESAVSLVPDSFIPDAAPQVQPAAAPKMSGADTLSLIGRNVWDAVVYHTPAAIAAAIEGDEPYKTTDWKDSLIERSRLRSQETAGKGPDAPSAIPGVSRADINSLGPSLGFSAVGAGAGLGAGVPAAIAGNVVAPGVGTVAGYGAGMLASGKAAFNMATNSFVRDLHDAANEESLKATGKPIKPEDFAAKQSALSDVIRSYGLWEAVPEAAGNALSFGILTAPVKGAIGKLFGSNIATRLASKMGALYGEELATETVTQTGQHNAEVAAGLTKAPERSFTSPQDLADSFKEVAPSTILQTTLMAGGFKAGQMGIERLRGRKSEEGGSGAPESGGPQPIEGTFIPADRGGPPAGPDATGGATYTQEQAPKAFARPALPAPSPLDGDVLGPQALPAGQAMLPPGSIDSTATEIKDAAPAPTLRQQALSRGLLTHSKAPSPDMLKRLMRIDDGMAQRLYDAWASAQTGPQQISPTDGGQDGQGQETAQEVSAADDDLTIPLPKSLERMTPGNRSLYKVDEIISSLPRLRTNLVISDSPDQRGVAYTPEKAMRQLLANRDNINDQDGKLRSGNRTGATTGMLLENIKHYHSTANDIRASRQESPQMWADYAARQAEVQKLNIGDAVLAPYGGPEDPFGAPAVIVKKNPKNWKVRYTTGVESELSLPPATLRPAPKVGADGTALDAAAHKAATSPLNDLPQPWIDSGKTKKPIAYKEPKGTAKPAAATAKAGPASFGKVGPAPGAARAISLKDNGDGTATVMAGDEPFYDFDSGDPVRVPADAKPSVVKQSIIDAGAVTSKDRWFGVNDGETLTKPASEVDKVKPAEDLAAMFDDVLAEEKDRKNQQPPAATETAVTAEVQQPARPKKSKTEEGDGIPDRIKEFYKPGNIILVDYWKTFDKVLEIKPGNYRGSWNVKVIQVVKTADGQWVPKDARNEPARWHATDPGKDKVVDRVEGIASVEQNAKSETQAALPSTGDTQDRAKDAKGNPIYRMGERVEYVSGQYEGRHGTISQVAPITTTVLGLSRHAGYHAESQETSYYYHVKTDNGSDFMASPGEIRFETARPEKVIPDIEVDGMVQDPERVHRAIGYAKQSAANARAAAQRARKTSSIAEHKRTAERNDAKAATYQSAWDAWAKQYPEEAEKIAPKKPEPAPAAATGEAPATGGAIDTAGILKAAGINVLKTTTNNGTPVWNVSGNTREHSDDIKAIGGRWYGPKKVWSFYNDDPSEELGKKLSGKVKPAAPPVLAENEVMLPGIPMYIYGKVGDGWHYKAASAKYAGYAGAIGGEMAMKLDAALKAKTTIAGKPTIEMSDAALERLSESSVASPVAKEKAKVELEKRDKADKPDLGAMFDEVLADEVGKGQHDELDAEMRGYERKAERKTQDRTAGQAAASAVKNTAAGLADAIDGLGKLFGSNGSRLSSGISFDEETYAKAKPLFLQAIAHFKDAGADLKEAMRAVVRLVLDKFGPQVAENMKAYVVRFMEDVRDGKVVYDETKEGAGNERSGDGQQGKEALAPVVAGEDGGPEGGGGIRVRNPGRGETGAAGNRKPEGAGIPPARSGRGSATAVHSAQAGTGDRVEATNVPAINFEITGDVQLGKGGESVKFADNIAAIETLKTIERERRRATPEEQRTLARYVGWGGLSNAFADPTTGEFKEKWQERGQRLAELLTPAELKAARRSTRNAHYTSETIVRGMWDIARRLGFSSGLVLEPSSGTGNFFGLAPKDITPRFIGVEFDSLTARIAQALYPQASVLHSGFQKVALPDDTFDLAIGNPPFGSESLRFQFKPELNGTSIHNQFFRASMDAVKPGGLQIMVVSRYLMDAQDSTTRAALARSAELVGAIRLPDTAFQENARTEVVTDILILRKLTRAEQADMDAAFAAARSRPERTADKERERLALAAKIPDWINTTEIKDPLGGDPMRVSSYFAEHGEMILGTLERSGSMRYENDITVRLDKGSDLGALMQEAISRLPADIIDNTDTPLAATEKRFKDLSDALRIALEGFEPGSIAFEKDGTLIEVVERETSGGTFELMKRPLTAESPWSSRLSIDSDGNWYEVVVVMDDEGKPVKRKNEQGKPTKFNLTEKVVYGAGENVPASLRLGEAKYERLVKLVRLRDILKEQLSLEAEDAEVGPMEANRRDLNAAYDGFVTAHGYISEDKNAALVSEMPDGALVMALEMSFRPELTPAKAKRMGEQPRKAEATKAAILSQRVVVPYTPPDKASSPADALVIALSESGMVDLDRIAGLLGMDEDGAINALHNDPANPLIFHDPETNRWETRDQYLSGQVKRKLQAARAANLDRNIRALEAVQPAAWGADQVTAILGSTWIPTQVYEDFIKHLTGEAGRVRFAPATNSFDVSAPVTAKGNEWKTDDASLSYLLQQTMNSAPIRLTWTDSDGKTHFMQEESALAAMKAKQIASEFQDWVFADGKRRGDLVELFNERFNTRVTRQHDGSHLLLPGKVPDMVIALRRHQKNAVWRGISERFMLLDHVVGAGKTFTAIARAMERRRMGLSKKPMIVVPNHMVEQFTIDIYRLYPGAKVLAAGKKDFEKKNRRRLFAKIATGDWDIVVVPHSSFKFISISPEAEERYLDAEIAKAQEAVKEAEEQAAEDGHEGWRKPFNVKQAEALVEKLEARRDKLKHDNVDRLLTFEQLGVDDLTVDEAHEFKNLYYSSKATDIRGMGNKSGSEKAYDLYQKVRVLRDSPTGTVTFMTGTPISNSAVEMYTVLRYLAAAELEDIGLDHFDSWRAQYVDASEAWEPTESGGLKQVKRLGRTWSNMRSLMELYYSVTDAVSMEDIKQWYSEDNNGQPFPVPGVKGGERSRVIVPPTEATKAALKDIIAGFDGLDGIEDVKERNAERLRLMDRARKVSVDVRCLNQGYTEPEKGGKVWRVAQEAKRIYDQWTPDRGTQLIFLDRSVPKAKGDDKRIKDYDKVVAERDQALRDNDDGAYRDALERLDAFDANEIQELRAAQSGGWNAYQQIKDNLIELGIPAKEIRFVQEANTDEQKQALFDAVNAGEIRILIGSTPRMGAGTNVQRRLVALHHVDVTWKPSDIEQREGRIIRQGNALLEKYGNGNFDVEILAYATERTMDAKMWDLNATKLRTINGIRKYSGEFTMEFEDEDAVGMAELAALASGDPLLLERVKLQGDLDRLDMLRRAWNRKVMAAKDRVDSAERSIATLPARIARKEELAERMTAELQKVRDAASKRRLVVEGEEHSYEMSAHRAALAAIEKQRAGDEKARFSIEVGGERITSKEALEDALGSAFGDSSPFEMTFDGKTYIQRNKAAAAITTKINLMATELGESKKTVSARVGEYLGHALEIDVVVGRWGAAFNYSISLVEKDGRSIASEESYVDKAKKGSGLAPSASAASLRALLKKLDESIGMMASGSSIAWDKRDLAKAREDLPTLREQANLGDFPQAEEMAEKTRRLEEVVRQLAGKGTTENPSADAAGAAESRAIAGMLRGAGSAAVRDAAEIVGRFVREFKRAADLDIRIVASPEEIPTRYRPSRNAEGVYHSDIGTIWLVTDNLMRGGKLNASRVFQVLLHEAVGHHGLAAMMGDKFKSLKARVLATAKAKGPVVDDYYKPGDADYATVEAVRLRYPFGEFKRKKVADAEVANRPIPSDSALREEYDSLTADEVLARMAETDPGRTLFGYVRAVVRQWLRDVARKIGVQLDTTVAELNDLVALASGYMRRGAGMAGDRAPSGVVAASMADSGLESRARPGANEAIWDAPDPTTADNVIYTLQDKHIDLKRVQAAIKDAIGQELPDQIDPYLQEELFHGRAAKATEEFLDRELQPLIGEMKQRGIGMDSLETYLWARHAGERNAQIAKINPDMPDGGSGLTDKQARDVLSGKDVTVGGQTVKGIEPAKLRGHAELARKIDMMVAGNRLLLELYELETPSTLAAWKGAYQHYVPLHREDVDSPWAGQGTGQGYSVRGASTKRATGSYRPVENILANLVMQRKRIITRGEKNRVAQAIYGLAKSMPNPDFWKVDDVPKTRVPKEMAIYHVMDGDTEVANYTRMSEADKHAAKIPGGYVYQSWGERVVEQDDPMFRSRPNVVWARFGGEDRFVIFNERDERAMRLAGALKNLDADDISHFLGEVSQWTRYFASINTQYNPVFGVVNLTRDTGTGLINLQSTPLKGKQAEMLGHVWQALPAIYRAIRIDREGGTPTGTWAELWEEFQEVGGQTGYRDMFRNATEQRDALEAALDPKWWQRKTWGKVISAGGLLAPAEQALLEKAGKPILDWLSDYNTTMENAIRLSAYKVARDHGMSRERAASAAKNLTVNFNRKGQAARQLGALYAFFNASVQGTARMLETLTHGRQPGKVLGRAGKQIVYGGLLLGSMQAMWLAAAGFDDDEPPEFVRDRAIIIPYVPAPLVGAAAGAIPGALFGPVGIAVGATIGAAIGAVFRTKDGKPYAAIPLPLGFHVLPALGRIGTEQVLNGFKAPGRAAFHVLDVMADAFNPIGNAGMSMQTLAPTVLDPAAALAENKDWTGKQIYRENFSQLDPKPGHQRTKDTATALSKWLSQALNSLTGGTEFQPGGLSPTPDQIDYLIGQVTGGVGREVSKLAQTGGAIATGEELPAYKIPLLGRFYGDAKGQAAVSSRFYENLKAMNMHQAEFMGLAKSDRGEQAKAYLEGHPEASMFREADRMQRYVGKLQDEKRKAIADRMPSAKVKEIDAKITEAMQGFNARVAARRAPAVPAQ